IPGAGVVPPSVPASLLVTRPSSLRKLRSPGRSITGSAETSAGIPLGSKPSSKPASSASFTGTLIGDNKPALGSCSTSTSLASPQVLPLNACRLERPTDQAGYWSVMPSVSDSTSKKTSAHAAIPNGDRTIRANRDSPGGPVSLPLLTKWNQAATSSTSTVSPNSPVVNPKCHSGNAFDHGTPKFDTYHQPLTLANDSATTNSTTAANSVRLRRERIAAAVTETAANAPSAPASPANTPKWWVHLVGVNIIAMNEMTVMPMMRRLGPTAVPGMRPLRSDIATDTDSATSNASTEKRRPTEPSGLAMNSRS